MLKRITIFFSCRDICWTETTAGWTSRLILQTMPALFFINHCFMRAFMDYKPVLGSCNKSYCNCILADFMLSNTVLSTILASYCFAIKEVIYTQLSFLTMYCIFFYFEANTTPGLLRGVTDSSYLTACALSVTMLHIGMH